MTILGVETSCDETGLSILRAEGGIKSIEIEIINEVLATQIETHRPWGGVVPHLARREHDENLPILLEELFLDQDLDSSDIDRLAVTVGPGLDPCLWSGINYVKSIHEERFSQSNLVGANHLEGHLYSFLLSKKFGGPRYKIENINKLFPAVQLVVSGGHTMIVLMKSFTDWDILGSTRDDAAGEAFDKVARMLDLPYPGGPEISKLAKNGNGDAVDFPRPMVGSGNYDFSFSGLKTAVLYYLKDNFDRKNEEELKFEVSDNKKADISASFQEAIVDTLTEKTKRAAKENEVATIMLSGGVAANERLREKLSDGASSLGIEFLTPPIEYNTDNGTIIALASFVNNIVGKDYELEAKPNLSL